MNEISLTRTRRLRLALRLTQQQFAEKIGQSQSTIDRLESGQQETGPQTLLLDIIERDIAAAAPSPDLPAVKPPSVLQEAETDAA